MRKGQAPCSAAGNPSSYLHFWATLSLHLNLSLHLPRTHHFLFLPENIAGFIKLNITHCGHPVVNSQCSLVLSITFDIAELPFPSWASSLTFTTVLIPLLPHKPLFPRFVFNSLFLPNLSHWASPVFSPPLAYSSSLGLSDTIWSLWDILLTSAQTSALNFKLICLIVYSWPPRGFSTHISI